MGMGLKLDTAALVVGMGLKLDTAALVVGMGLKLDTPALGLIAVIYVANYLILAIVTEKQRSRR